MLKRPTLELPLLGALALIFVSLLTTLNYPALNADEGLHTLILTEGRALLQGNLPSLNPVIDYEGPLDFWITGSVYGLTAWLTSWAGAAWMVRIVPFVLFWLASWALYNELKRWDRERAIWIVFVTCTLPYTLVHSKIAWPHSILLVTAFYLATETLRAHRTRRVRWWRVAITAGIGIEAHTTGYLALGICGVIAWPVLRERWRVDRWRMLGVCALLVLFAIPELRNFPPPVAVGFGARPFALQVRSLLNVVSGIHSYEYIIGRDPAPTGLLMVFLAALGGILALQLSELYARRRVWSKWDRLVATMWLLYGSATFFMLVMFARGRTLETYGNERYLVAFVPGWALIQGDAFYRAAQRLRTVPRQAALACALYALMFGRFLVPIVQALPETDPSLLAARWLQEHCPRERCLAYAETFWNYWPLRFYSRDSIDVNWVYGQWKEQPKHERGTRELATCWYRESQHVPHFVEGVKYRERVEFPSQKGRIGAAQVCLVVPAG